MHDHDDQAIGKVCGVCSDQINDLNISDLGVILYVLKKGKHPYKLLRTTDKARCLVIYPDLELISVALIFDNEGLMINPDSFQPEILTEVKND